MQCYTDLYFNEKEVCPKEESLITAERFHAVEYSLRRTMLANEQKLFLEFHILPREDFHFIGAWVVMARDKGDGRAAEPSTYGFLLFHAHTINALVLLARSDFYGGSETKAFSQFLKTWKFSVPAHLADPKECPKWLEILAHMRNFVLSKHSEHNGYMPLRFGRSYKPAVDLDFEFMSTLTQKCIPTCPIPRPRKLLHA